MSVGYNRKLIFEKANKYSNAHGFDIIQEIGHGTQGIVYQTSVNTAIKVYDLFDGYARERDVYFRLKRRSLDCIRSFKIPRILDSDDNLFILEMSIVHTPCILDFGGAYLDDIPGHIQLRDEEWELSKKEEFGENWDEAKAIIKEIEFKADIWLVDINTGNIKFEGF